MAYKGILKVIIVIIVGGWGGAVSNTARQIHGVDSDTINFCFFFPLRLKEPLNFVGVHGSKLLDTGASFIQACLSFSIV